MNAATLYPLFLPTLRRAGRWLIRRLVKWGLPRVIDFLEMRIDTFIDRRKRAHSHRRRNYLTFRITWRRTVLRWLKRYKTKLTAKLIKGLNKLYDKGLERIPWDAANDSSYGSWVRKYA